MSKRRPKKRSGPRPLRAPRPSTPKKANLQNQIVQLQEQMAREQEALKEVEVTATVGGGMVTVVANGHQEVLSITIEPEVVDPEDVEMLQDMILAAVNEAIERSQEFAASKLGSLTGGLNIPGLNL